MRWFLNKYIHLINTVEADYDLVYTYNQVAIFKIKKVIPKKRDFLKCFPSYPYPELSDLTFLCYVITP